MNPVLLRAPEWLYGLLLLPLLAPLAVRSLSGLSPGRRVVSLLLRALLLATLVVALARPAEQARTSKLSTVFLADVSDSVTDAELAQMSRFIEQARAVHGQHHMELLSFAKDAHRLPIHSPVSLTRHADGSGTNIQLGISLALSLLAHEHLGQLVLLSDGRETAGDLMQAIAQLASLNLPLFVLPNTAAPAGEVAVTALEVPERLKVGEPFTARVRIESTVAEKVRVKFFQNDILLGVDGVRDVDLEPGVTELGFRTISHVSGPVHERVEVVPKGADHFTQNNVFARTSYVEGRPRVLYIEGVTGESSAFQSLLESAGFEVDVRSSRGVPNDARELGAFDFVVLSDVPREQLGRTSMQALETYLQQGGGFLMAGGAQSFGLGGYRGTSLESLLPVRLDTERRRDQPSLALVLVIDKSGSMSGEKMELAKEAARATSELLGSEDFLGVIGFDAEPSRVVRLAPAGNRLAISRGISKLSAGGGTQIFPAVDAAYADLMGVRARLKHVIVLTDGQTQERGLPLLVQNMQVDGITVSTIGLGSDVHRNLIEELARLGHGRAYFTTDPSSVPRLFVKETHAVARSSAVEDYVGVRVNQSADFMRGVPIQSAPALRGYVATRARPFPAQVLLESELGEPVLARMRVGLGWSLAWTSDVKPRWSAGWFSWPSHSAFWAQLIREHMRTRSQSDTLRLTARIERDEIIATLEVLDDEERFVNGLEGTLSISDQSETSSPTRHPLQQTSPGRYEARAPLKEPGSYAVKAELGMPGDPGTRLVGRTSLAFPFPMEYAQGAPQQERLLAAARATGGDGLYARDPASVWAARGRETVTWKERWPWCLWLALGLWLTDIAARRWPARGGPARSASRSKRS